MDLSHVPKFIVEAIDKLLAPYGASLELLTRKAKEPTGRYLTYTEATEYMRISSTTLWRLVQRGELSAIHCGSLRMFDVTDIDKFMVKRKRRGPG